MGAQPNRGILAGAPSAGNRQDHSGLGQSVSPHAHHVIPGALLNCGKQPNTFYHKSKIFTSGQNTIDAIIQMHS